MGKINDNDNKKPAAHVVQYDIVRGQNLENQTVVSRQDGEPLLSHDSAIAQNISSFDPHNLRSKFTIRPPR